NSIESDKHERRDDGPEAEHKGGVRALPLAEQRKPRRLASEPADRQEPDRAEEEDRGDAEHPPPKRRDVVSLRAVGGERRLPVAPAEGERDGDGDQGREPSLNRRHGRPPATRASSRRNWHGSGARHE